MGARRSRDLIGVILVAAFVLLAASFGLDERAPWWSGFLLELGSTFLVLVPVLLITSALESKIESTDRAVEEANQDIQALSRDLDQTRVDMVRTVEEMSTSIAERLAADKAADRKLFSSLTKSPSRADVMSALKRARELEITSDIGVRVPLDFLSYYVWFKVDGDRISVNVQTIDFKSVYSTTWDDSEGPMDLWYRVGKVLEQNSGWIESAYHPASTFQHVQDILNLGLRAMAEGNRYTFRHTFMVIKAYGGDRPAWVVTDRLLASVEMSPYVIDFDRLDEDDWDPHMRAKSWVDIGAFREAFDVATHLVAEGLVTVNSEHKDWDPWSDAIDGNQQPD